MNKESFEKLLTDLYALYNPANLELVNDLAERYRGGMEFDSIKTIFIKYNRKSANYYNPDLGSDEYVHSLIKDYNNGNFSLENATLESLKKQEVEVVEKDRVYEELEKVQQTQSQTKEEISEKLKTVEDAFKEKEEALKNSLQNTVKMFEQRIREIQEKAEKKVEIKEDTTIRIILNNSDTEIDLPNKKYIAALGTGARLIVPDKTGKPVGLEILDITFDSFSDISGIPVIEIIVQKI